MRGVVLSFDSDQQLAASTDFLRQVHPLTHTAAVKKSQVRRQAMRGASQRKLKSAPPNAVASQAAVGVKAHKGTNHGVSQRPRRSCLCAEQAHACTADSQVHHALCEMLSDVLRPLVRSNLPAANAANLSPQLLQEWYTQVMA